MNNAKMTAFSIWYAVVSALCAFFGIADLVGIIMAKKHKETEAAVSIGSRLLSVIVWLLCAALYLLLFLQ